MRDSKIKLFFFFIFILTLSCGFKPVDKSILLNYNIKSLEIKNSNKVNYLIKNKIENIFSNKKAKSRLNIKILSSLNKNIKEKNIKNQITKYEIILSGSVELNYLDINEKRSFSVSQKGNYNVASSHADTIKNQNNLETLLAEKVAEEIINKMILLSNDL